MNGPRSWVLSYLVWLAQVMVAGVMLGGAVRAGFWLVETYLAWAGFDERWLIGGVLAAFFGMSLIILSLWRDPHSWVLEDGDGSRGSVSLSRAARLALAARHMPVPTPAGWTNPVTARRSVGWRFQVGDILVHTWADEAPAGAYIHVAMSHPGSDRAVDVAPAAKILEHFGSVGMFMEADSPPANMVKLYPGVRSWGGLAKNTAEVLSKLPVPSTPPAPPANPLRELVRVLLPEKLPLGWSPPVAVDGLEDGWSMLVEDRVVLAMPVADKDGLRLMVSVLSREAQEPVSTGESMDVLRHFRGVREFVQVQDTDELQGGRSFLAEIAGAKGVRGKQRAEMN